MVRDANIFKWHFMWNRAPVQSALKFDELSHFNVGGDNSGIVKT